MPGFTSECMSGAHQMCMEPTCRCSCHPATQALIRKGPDKPSGKGGINRKVRTKIAEAAAMLPELQSNGNELHNTCPKCKAVCAPTDNFCRKDGTRLMMGKACERCASPCDESDFYCWGCGWKLGDPLPVIETEIPVEDVKAKLRAKLIEKGYPVPDTLV